MDINNIWLSEVMAGFLYFFTNPFLYLFFLVLYTLYRRLVIIERTLFHIKMESVWNHIWQSLLYGLLGGIIASAAVMGLGIVLSVEAIWLLLAIALLLSLIHVKYACFAYAGGLLALLSYIASWTPQWDNYLWHLIADLHVPSILAFVAVLHLVEGLLAWRHAAHGASPLFIRNKRGRIIGGYQMQKYWLLPVMTVVAVDSGGVDAGAFSSWWPLLGAAPMIKFLPVPVVIGYSSMAISETPREKAGYSFRILILYSLILLGLSVGAFYYQPLIPVAALFSFIGHDLVIWVINRRDWERPPLFVQEKDGVRVLAVVPGSPAAEMGIEPGDVIQKINGVRVNEKEDLYPAIQKHPAFCKMEVMNAEQNLKFLQRSLYEGEHHQLGIIVAPDEDARYYTEMSRRNLWGWIRKPVNRAPQEESRRDSRVHERLDKINT
ncbi:MAG: PDZ domain-containing protein [Bacillaceae bacterium]|nr:PDZ domain-containing protein [Bacillaceae bacterium]